MKHNVAMFRLLVDGTDYAATMTPRLQSLSLTEQLEDNADRLEITLTNQDGKLAPISRGVYVELALGWKEGPDVTAGLVDKGRFLVDQIEKSGPPDILRITARSADLTDRIRNRRDKAHKATTIGEVVRQVAGENGLNSRIHGDLAGIVIPSAEQAAKSDIAFIRDLGRRYDAIATIKNRTLIFMPIGADLTATGQRIPPVSFARRDNARFTFTIADREDHDGAEAQWHDGDAARKRTVKHGAATNPKRIKRKFASAQEAADAAKAEARRVARGQFTMSYDMPLGDAAIEPNRKARVTGFDSEIDAIQWLIKEVTHSLDGSAGFITAVQMESVT